MYWEIWTSEDGCTWEPVTDSDNGNRPHRYENWFTLAKEAIFWGAVYPYVDLRGRRL